MAAIYADDKMLGLLADCMLQWPRPYLLYGAVLLVVLRFWMGEWTGTAVCKFQREHVIELFPHDAGSLEEGR